MYAAPGTSSDSEIRFTRKEIYLMVKDHLNSPLSTIIEHLENHVFEKTGYSIQVGEEMKVGLSTLFHSMRFKWKNARRIESRFFQNFEDWLGAPVAFRIPKMTSKTPKHKRGRPSSEFLELSERSKRRKTQDIRSNFSSEVSSYATHMSLRASGKVDASEVIKDIVSKSPSTAKVYRKSMHSVTETSLSADSALSVLIENKLSKRQYLGLRTVSRENNCQLYPSYKVILDAKRRCYPPAMDITMTESSAEVKLQALLDHSVQRILFVLSNSIKNLAPADVRHMHFICKWGCDGSSGHSMYKQAFDDHRKSDSDIFITSFVPMKLVSAQGETVVWKNARPSSPRFCRPIRVQFLHENTEATVNEVAYIEEQIKDLVPFNTVIDGNDISISYKLALTMVDGKVCNAISSTSSTQRCYLCGATTKEFYNIDTMIQKEVNEAHLRFGLSTLHAWIRFFECCLHLAYKLTIKKWQARSKEDKEVIKNRKAMLQHSFRTELGLIVDRPKPGSGNTNDGNTARRFFVNYSVSASITGVDEDLIHRFYIILQAISSGHEINTDEFKKYTTQTARKFVELYSWYYMPTSVHKVLIHGPQIVSSALLPIGQLSEDAQEHVNKFMKRFREDFSRKCSRIKTMEDVFLRLLVSSDPYISNLRNLPQTKVKKLSPDAVKLLIPPVITMTEASVTDTHSDRELHSCHTDDDTDSSSDDS